MNSIQRYLVPRYLNEHLEDYTIVDTLIFARPLNRLLKQTDVRREFHRCSIAADAVKRWEVLEHFDFDHYPEPRRPLEGERFLYPWQVVTLDWDWNLGPGRRPNYHRFVMLSLCHWRAKLDLASAQLLRPDFDWCVVTADRHTVVIAPTEHLIWDMSYFAMRVTAQEELTTVYGEQLD